MLHIVLCYSANVFNVKLTRSPLAHKVHSTGLLACEKADRSRCNAKLIQRWAWISQSMVGQSLWSICNQFFRHVERKSFLSRCFHMDVVQSDLWTSRWHLSQGFVGSHSMHLTFVISCFSICSLTIYCGVIVCHTGHISKFPLGVSAVCVSTDLAGRLAK